MYNEYYSLRHCDLCRGEGDGFKCPKCGAIEDRFSSSHKLKCTKGGVLQVRCKKCGEAESNCRCGKA